jgi:hypothetical protein
MVPGNYQGKKRIEQRNVHDQPGVYKVKLPCVPVRTLGTVMLEMVDKNGLYFSDEFALTFHLHYYRLLKWLIVFPLLGMVGFLSFSHKIVPHFRHFQEAGINYDPDHSSQ